MEQIKCKFTVFSSLDFSVINISIHPKQDSTGEFAQKIIASLSKRSIQLTFKKDVFMTKHVFDLFDIFQKSSYPELAAMYVSLFSFIGSI